MNSTTDRVLTLLEALPVRKLDALKELFWQELNYDRANEPVSTRNWTSDRAQQALAEAPLRFATAGGAGGGFNVFYCRLRGDLLVGDERPIIQELLAHEGAYALYIFSDASQTHWHFVNVKYDKDVARRRLYRRIKVGPEERLRTAAERIALLDPTALGVDLFGVSLLAIQEQHEKAFDVEAVTDAFFKAYLQVFQRLQTELFEQTDDLAWAHDYALQTLNRIMFLYFVQRKRWLGDNPDFIADFWRAYRRQAQGSDTFFEDWLQVLFFEAFNNRFQAGRGDRQHFPENIRQALAMAPYLNGGLFERNDLDRKYAVHLGDDLFASIFNFFEGYNFTISEDTPLDQEVAVDPEMIGKVYESLVNVSEEADERGEAGIFYTPRTEIDLMCRLSLVDWLANHLGSEVKPLLYEIVFAFDNAEKADADARAREQNLWPALYDLLSGVQVVDPACGSGSFLVGMLLVLDDLLRRADWELGAERTSYERRKSIIGSSLYGVDVMAWAIHVAELRLWLQLVIETDLAPAELKFRPLLPNLSFKLRVGDSLVQEVGGVNLGLRHGRTQLAPALKGRITHLKGQKLKFYHNEEDREFKTAEALQQAELQLFRDILAARAQALHNEIVRKRDQASQLMETISMALPGVEEKLDTTSQANRQRILDEIEGLEADLAQTKSSLEALRRAQDVPFVWDIAFVEVFEGDNAGFDLVIGNPPYVRTQSIADPLEPKERVTKESKTAYKAKLARAIYSAFPRTFGYDLIKDSSRWKLSSRCDLYVYFYLYGLSLLNPQGSFCFITSNSWLDANYGKDLQEFLITRGRIKLIIDNQTRRSFASAQVNTVIVLFGSVTDSTVSLPTSLQHIARFIMLRVPFEIVLSSIVWQEIADTNQRSSKPEYRVLCYRQAELFENGSDISTSKYAGDKWGGKYLRAPDIFGVIIEKGSGKLVPLSKLSDVNEGRPTGANDFFFVPMETARHFGIEREFLRPGLMKTRGANYFRLREDNLDRYFLQVTVNRRELSGTRALEYIKYGESIGLNKRATFSNKANWFRFPARPPADLVAPCGIGATFFCAINDGRAIASNSFTEIRLHSSESLLAVWLTLNSVIGWLYLELVGRSTLGGGMLKVDPIEYRHMPVLHPKECPLDIAILDREIGALHMEVEQSDRRALDDIIFDVLGLTQTERDAVYEEFVKLVEARLQKAQSV